MKFPVTTFQWFYLLARGQSLFGTFFVKYGSARWRLHRKYLSKASLYLWQRDGWKRGVRGWERSTARTLLMIEYRLWQILRSYCDHEQNPIHYRDRLRFARAFQRGVRHNWILLSYGPFALCRCFFESDRQKVWLR